MTNKIFIAGIFMMMISLVAAAGISTPYWDENPLKLAPGESTTVTLNLQNMAGEEKEIFLKAEIIEGKEIAALDKEKYNVPFGRDNVPVKIKVEIPDSDKISKNYEVVISFIQVSSETGEMVHVAGAFTSKLPVQIVGIEESVLFKEKSSINYNWIITVLAIVVIFSILVYYIRKKK